MTNLFVEVLFPFLIHSYFIHGILPSCVFKTQIKKINYFVSLIFIPSSNVLHCPFKNAAKGFGQTSRAPDSAPTNVLRVIFNRIEALI